MNLSNFAAAILFAFGQAEGSGTNVHHLCVNAKVAARTRCANWQFAIHLVGGVRVHKPLKGVQVGRSPGAGKPGSQQAGRNTLGGGIEEKGQKAEANKPQTQLFVIVAREEKKELQEFCEVEKVMASLTTVGKRKLALLHELLTKSQGVPGARGDDSLQGAISALGDRRVGNAPTRCHGA